MKTLRFANGDLLPALGLGTWLAKPGEVYQAVKTALELGYRHFDCAFIYGNEAEVGRALSEAMAAGTVTRSELWITSKLWNHCHLPEDVEPALRGTLQDLGLDYLDLYLIHWPVAHRKGIAIPKQGSEQLSPAEAPATATWSAMEALVDQGLVKHIGVSNFSISKIQELLPGARHRPAMNQVELHPYLQQPELVAFCRSEGIHVTAYSPLGSPGRAHKAADEPVLLKDAAVAAIATEVGASPAQVLLAWALTRGTAVIPKSVNPARLAQNLAAADVELSAEQMSRLHALDRARRYVDGTFWALEGGPWTVETLWA